MLRMNSASAALGRLGAWKASSAPASRSSTVSGSIVMVGGSLGARVPSGPVGSAVSSAACLTDAKYAAEARAAVTSHWLYSVTSSSLRMVACIQGSPRVCGQRSTMRRCRMSAAGTRS